MSLSLSPEQLRRLARLGAVTRLQQLRSEEAAIRAEFPELFGRGPRDERASPETGYGPTAHRRGRRRMSAAQKKRVSERMRKYWAERRKSKAAK